MIISFEAALLRMGLAVIFGALIGIERQWRHKNAGLKTNTLVALGAAGFAMVSDTFGPENHNPAQIAAAIVGGIGFLGAGVIIRRGATVQGVTTAATLWANASMGLAIGIGQIGVAGAIFTGIIGVQLTMRRIGAYVARFNDRRLPGRYEFHVECDDFALRAVEDAWREFARASDVVPLRRHLSRLNGRLLWRVDFGGSDDAPVDFTKVEEQLVGIAGVHRLELVHVNGEDDSRRGALL